MMQDLDLGNKSGDLIRQVLSMRQDTKGASGRGCCSEATDYRHNEALSLRLETRQVMLMFSGNLRNTSVQSGMVS